MLAAGHEPQTEASAVQHKGDKDKRDKRQQHEPVEFKSADIHQESLFLSDILNLRGNIVGILGSVYRLDDNGCRCDAEHIKCSTDNGLVSLEVYAGYRKQC